MVITVSSLNQDDKNVTLGFEVRDTGIGINPEAQARLFHAFTQADGSNTRKYGGTGLGLVISKKLAALMHGDMQVRSEPGHGAVFSFTAKFEKQTNAHPSVEHLDLSGLRLLIVDDNATNREVVSQLASRWQMTSTPAEGGKEALEQMRAAAAKGVPFQLAILDMQMPEMDGAMLAHAIKADPALAVTRLVLLTSLGHALTPEEMKQSGIEVCVLKPVKEARLFAAAASVMARGEGELKARTQLLPTAISPPPAPVNGQPARILLAEDNVINQKVLLGMLRKLGHSANVAKNGREALAMRDQHPYEIILMDCQMPELDGYEATIAIRDRADDRRNVRIVAITANALLGEAEKCLAVGMDDYLSKPVRLDALRLTREVDAEVIFAANRACRLPACNLLRTFPSFCFCHRRCLAPSGGDRHDNVGSIRRCGPQNLAKRRRSV